MRDDFWIITETFPKQRVVMVNVELQSITEAFPGLEITDEGCLAHQNIGPGETRKFQLDYVEWVGVVAADGGFWRIQKP